MGKSLWESTHDVIDPRDIDSDFSDVDSEMDEEETKKVAEKTIGVAGK